MDFSLSPRAADLRDRVRAFVADEIEPIEAEAHRRITRLRESGGDSWTPDPVIGELQAKARAQGLWNLFLPAAHAGRYAADFGTDGGEGLTNVDYAPVAEAMGRSFLAPLVFNSNAPDTGNMEVLLKYGTDEQREQWLEPLLRGEIRSAFCMTEPAVASSDATNMAATAEVDGDEIVINGRKWWSTGVGNPDCKVLVFMGLSDPEADRHSRHTMVLVPRDAEGVRVERMLTTMGYYDEPLGHGEVSFDNVRVPASNVLLGPGRAFEIAQGRLGPGRVHHCMRAIGLAERALELACARAVSRTAFGKPIANLGGNRERIADARIAINRSRLLVMHAAWLLDQGMSREAYSAVSEIKVEVPNMALDVIDMAIQLHGGGGLSDDFPLASAWVGARSLRLADGPDEVHRNVIAKIELGKHDRMSTAGCWSPAPPPAWAPHWSQRSARAATRCSPPTASTLDGIDLVLDITSDDDWATAVDAVRERWGGLDVLVNNAGVAGGGRVDRCTLEEWQWITDINLFGLVRGTKAFVPMLKEQRAGHLVNVASLAGLVHPGGMGSYNAVKAAVVAFTETCGHELASYGIRASVVCPSYFRTNLMDSMQGSDEAVGRVVGGLVERSQVTADDIAAAVLAGMDAGEDVIVPDEAARQAYFLKWADRPAYDAVMRDQAAKLESGAQS